MRIGGFAVCMALAACGVQPGEGRVTGAVLDEGGQPIAGAGVEILGQPRAVGVTDASGAFAVDGDPAAQVVLKFSALGFGTAYRDIALGADAPYYVAVRLRLAPAVHTVSADEASSVSEGSVQLDIPAGSFCLPGGGKAHGNVGVSIVPYGAVDLAMTPGSLTTVDGGALISLGMADISVRQDGAELVHCGDEDLTLAMAVAGGLDVTGIDRYHNWVLDPTLGLWRDRGPGKFDPTSRAWTVNTRQLTPHNVDQNVPTSPCSGTVMDGHHRPIRSIGINGHVCSVAGCDYQAWDRGASTNASGYYAMDLPVPHNGDVFSFTMTNPPSLPDQRFYDGPWPLSATQGASYPNQNFQYCLVSQASCRGSDLCCSGACSDGLCP